LILVSRCENDRNFSIRRFPLNAVGYLTWTFFARRVKVNPTFYGAESTSNEHVEEFLFSVVKETLAKLRDEGCVEASTVSDLSGSLQKTALGVAASKYYLKYNTPKQMQFGVREARKMISQEIDSSKGSAAALDQKLSGKYQMVPFTRPARVDEVSAASLLYALASTHEFDEVPVRHNEEILNEELSDKLKWGPDTAVLFSPNGKRRFTSPDVFADPHTK
jgi:activating signal cointegrator complex subunit 3